MDRKYPVAFYVPPGADDMTTITDDGETYVRVPSPPPSLSLARTDPPAVDADLERLRQADRRWGEDLAWQNRRR